MTVNTLLLEEGPLSDILDESSFSILLEDSTLPSASSSIFTYGFGSGSSIADIITFGFNIPEIIEISTASIVTYGLGNDAVLEKILVYGFNLPPLDTITGYLNLNFVSDVYFVFSEDSNFIAIESDEYDLLLKEVDYRLLERRTLQPMGVISTPNQFITGSVNKTLSNMTTSTTLRFDTKMYGQAQITLGALSVLPRTDLTNYTSSVITFQSLSRKSVIRANINENFGSCNKTLQNLTLVGRGARIRPNTGRLSLYVY